MRLLLVALSLLQLSIINLPYPREVFMYVESFKKLYNNSYVLETLHERYFTFSVRYEEISFSEIPLSGYCRYATNTIYISPKSFQKYDEQKRQRLVDHEMGHCLLGRVHNYHYTLDKNPKSVMFPGLSGNFSNYENVREELFDASQQGKLGAVNKKMIQLTGPSFKGTDVLEQKAYGLSVPEIEAINDLDSF